MNTMNEVSILFELTNVIAMSTAAAVALPQKPVTTKILLLKC